MQNKYEIIEIVGEGAFGIVMKCRNKENGELVAIKKFKDSEDEVVQKSMIRELKVLKKLKHENIVGFKECFKRKGKMYLVFEYVDKNLLQVLEQTKDGLDTGFLKRIIYGICKAIIYIHQNETLHRDIKPENILITDEGVAKVCDFGFARSPPQKGGLMTDYVATRWYRSPELLLSCTNYGKAVDFWAVGCIMGELADCQPMFPGDTELDTLVMIQKLIGNLPQSLLEIFYNNQRLSVNKLDNVIKPETLERRYSGKLNKSAISFMKSLLKLDWKERLTGVEVLMHTYFDDLRNEDPEFSHLKKESKINLKTNRNNKFQNTKNNFNSYNNISKSPPKETSVVNNYNNKFDKVGKTTKKIVFNEKEALNSNIPYNSNTNNKYNPNLTNGLNYYNSCYKSIYNTENKDNIYNFDIGINNLDKNSEIVAQTLKKRKKEMNTIHEEEEIEKLNKRVYDTKFNLKYKPDTGADYCDEDFYKYNNSPKNIVLKSKKLIKEDSPEKIHSTNTNFLPHISTHRGFGDFVIKKDKK